VVSPTTARRGSGYKCFLLISVPVFSDGGDDERVSKTKKGIVESVEEKKKKRKKRGEKSGLKRGSKVRKRGECNKKSRLGARSTRENRKNLGIFQHGNCRGKKGFTRTGKKSWELSLSLWLNQAEEKRKKRCLQGNKNMYFRASGSKTTGGRESRKHEIHWRASFGDLVC